MSDTPSHDPAGYPPQPPITSRPGPEMPPPSAPHRIEIVNLPDDTRGRFVTMNHRMDASEIADHMHVPDNHPPFVVAQMKARAMFKRATGLDGYIDRANIEVDEDGSIRWIEVTVEAEIE